MRRTVLVAVLAALVGALVATPIAVFASHSFTDVPDSNTFHADIEWLADAGVTKGCNPPANTEYCPKDEVTREQMAAFMRRLAVNQVVDADMVDGQHASAFVLRSKIPSDGATSCAGAGFYPTDRTVDYQGTAPRTGSGSSASAFVCALDIPNSATVTRFTAGLHDSDATFFTGCTLIRQDVTGDTLGLGVGNQVEMASTPFTSGSFGNQTVTTSDIEFPQVDATRYSYFAACGAGASSTQGIHGVVVEYSLP